MNITNLTKEFFGLIFFSILLCYRSFTWPNMNGNGTSCLRDLNFKKKRVSA